MSLCVIMQDMGDNSVDNYPRLVGGTFLCTLLQYKKDPRVEEAEFFKAFLKVLGGDVDIKRDEYGCSQGRTEITRLKKCTAESFKKSFLDPTELSKKLDNFDSICADLEGFINKYIDEKSVDYFVADLLQLIKDDSSDIKKSFLLDNKRHVSIDKSLFLNAESVSLPYVPFIASVSIYAFSEKNKNGQNTVDKWAESEKRNARIIPRIRTEYRGKVVNSSDLRVLVNKGNTIDNISQKTCSTDSSNEKKLGSHHSLSNSDFDALFKQKGLDDLKDSVNNHLNLYVETSTYRETLHKVLKLGCVMLTGNPGVGKTMTSEMVAIKMAGLGFEIHYTKGGYDTLSKISDEVFSDDNRKDFILIDDCMGRAIFELSKGQENTLQYFIARVQNNRENKKLLLNSRIRVIQDLNEEDHEDCLNRYDEMIRRGQVVEALTMSVIERAHLLRNHIFSRLPEEYYEDLSGDNCLDIVVNPHFNPRVIDHATNPRYVVKIQEKGDFYWSLQNAFDDPEAVWRKIYYDEQSTPDEAKVLLKALFSVSTNACNINICRKIFEAYWNKEDSGRAWDIALTTQNGSTVKKVRKKDSKEHWYEEISLIDPSFADFLERSIYREGSAERNSLKDGVVYERQLIQVYGVLEYSAIKKQMALDGRLENLIYDNEVSKVIDIFKYIALSQACRDPLKRFFNERVTKFRKGKGLYFHDGDRIVTDCSLMLVALISNKGMREFYLGGKISRQLYDYLTFYLSIDECLDIISAYLKNKDCFSFEYGRPEIEDLIKNSVDNSFNECSSRDMASIEGPIEESILVECNNEVNEEIRNRCFESLDLQKHNLPDDLIVFFTKTINGHETVDYTDRIKEYGKELEEYDEYESYEEAEATQEEINEVKALFSEKFSPRKEML